MFSGVDDLDAVSAVRFMGGGARAGNNGIGVRAQFRSRWFVAGDVVVRNWDLTPLPFPIRLFLGTVAAHTQRMGVLAQGFAGVAGAVLTQVFGGAGGHDFATSVAAFGAEVD